MISYCRVFFLSYVCRVMTSSGVSAFGVQCGNGLPQGMLNQWYSFSLIFIKGGFESKNKYTKILICSKTDLFTGELTLVIFVIFSG